MVMVVSLNGQPMTVRSTVVSASTDPLTGTYSVIGQPFYLQMADNDYEFAYGVAQAQLETVEVSDETCENEPYTENGFDIPASALSVGSSNLDLYSNNVDPHGYDRRTMLTLTVWPVYFVEVSDMYHGVLPVIDGSVLQDGADYQVVEGDNVIYYKTIHGCDSVVTAHVSLCPFTVKDADSNLYNTLVLDKYCWTQSNLKTTHYFGDAHIEIPYALVYSPGEDVNEGIYGRLYTWYSAVNVPEGSTILPTLDNDGFVRGICPAGWHLPAEPEIEVLASHTTDEIHSTNYWVLNPGFNTTGFSLLPAGYYNSSMNRFEGLGTESRFWKIVGYTTYAPEAFCTAYYCGSVVPISPVLAADAFSVRCVKNY